MRPVRSGFSYDNASHVPRRLARGCRRSLAIGGRWRDRWRRRGLRTFRNLRDSLIGLAGVVGQDGRVVARAEGGLQFESHSCAWMEPPQAVGLSGPRHRRSSCRASSGRRPRCTRREIDASGDVEELFGCDCALHQRTLDRPARIAGGIRRRRQPRLRARCRTSSWRVKAGGGHAWMRSFGRVTWPSARLGCELVDGDGDGRRRAPTRLFNARNETSAFTIPTATTATAPPTACFT